MGTLSRLSRNALLMLVLLPVTAAAGAAPRFEKPPTLEAQVLAPASLLSGEGFHVDEQVPTDGLMAHFTIQSDVGTFPANSVEMLKIRVAEIPAIIQLTQTSKSKVFAESMATNAVRPVQAAGQMIMHPSTPLPDCPRESVAFSAGWDWVPKRSKRLPADRKGHLRDRRPDRWRRPLAKRPEMSLAMSRSGERWRRNFRLIRTRRIQFFPNNSTTLPSSPSERTLVLRPGCASFFLARWR